jgi:hypothetical protein
MLTLRGNRGREAGVSEKGALDAQPILAKRDLKIVACYLVERQLTQIVPYLLRLEGVSRNLREAFGVRS